MSAPDEARRIKLLLVVDEMEVGGTQRQIVNIVRGLDHQHFAITLLYFRNRSHLATEVERAGVDVHCVARSHRFDPSFVARLRAFLRRGRFDVMHCFSLSGEFWGALARRLLPQRQRPALVTSIRGTYEWYSHSHWRVKRWLTRQSSAVVANSRSGAEFAAEKMQLRPETFLVIYNGVALAALEPHAPETLRAALAGAHRTLIVFVGRLVDHKDVPTLLRAAGRLARGSRPMIALAGDGPLRGELESIVRERGLSESVVLLGECASPAALIDAGDMLVLPSVREGLSNVILEAMIAGKPVIASRAGGNVELIIDDVDGLLFDVGDDAALAGAIERLIHDPALRLRLGEAARAKALRNFSVPAMAEALDHCYRSVVRPAGIAGDKVA